VPDKKISELPDGAPPQDIDEYVIARAGSNFSLSYGAMTSGGVSSLSGVGAVTVATNGSTISIGAPAQSVQTQNVHNVTLSGNTAGVMAQVSSGTLTLAGGNNITVSQNGNAVTISGANVGGAQTGISGIANSQTTYTSGTVSLSELGAITIRSTTGNQFQFSVNPQSTQVETQTFVAGIIASDTTYTSGNVRFTGVGGGITVSSNTGQRVDLSVAAPVAQTNQAGSVYAISNTSGTSSGTYDARTLSIAGAGMITVAASNSGWRINATQSVQPETQTAISGIANSQTTYTSGTVSLSELGAITIRSTTGNQYQLSVNAQTNQAGSVYAISNTSGTSSGTYDARTLSIAGAGMITVAASNSGWRINATQSVQPETQTAISGIANSQTTYTSGTVSLSELGAITIRSTTGNQFQLSVNAQTTQTQGILSIGVSTGGNTLGNTTVNTGSRFVIVGTNGITASQGTAAGATTVTLSGVTQSVQTQGILNVALSNVGNTAGDTGINSGTRMVLAGGNNITLSASSAANATTITISGPNTVAQTNQAGSVYAISNTSGTSSGTYDARTLSIAGAGLVTVAASNSGWRVDATNQNLSAGVSNVGNTSGNTTVNTGSRLVFAGGNNITLSQGTAAGATTITISAPNLGAGAMSAGASNLGNTAGATGITGTQLVLVGSGPVSLSQTTGANGGTLSILAPATSSLSATGIVSLSTNGSTISVGAPAYSGGMSTMGNTSGDTGYASQRLNLAGGANITLSGSTNGGSMTITVSGGAGGGFSAGMSTEGNTAGNTGVTGTRLVIVGSGPVSLSQTTGAAGGTLSILAPATSSLSATGLVSISTNGSTISIGVPGTMADWQNFPQGQAALNTLIAGISKTPFYWHEYVPGRITANSLVYKMSMVTANTLASFTAHLGVYTFVNSTSMALLGSLSEEYVVSSATSASLSGIRHFLMTKIGTHTALSTLGPGNYGFGMMFSAGATQSMNASLMGAATASYPLGLIMPGTNSVSAGTSQGAMALWGRGSTTVNALPANVVRSELVNQGSGASAHLHPWIYIRS
jgi:hypothetical protein